MSRSQDRSIEEAILESSEVVADVLMQGDALADVPIIGTAIKLCRAADSIRDRALVMKLAAFVRHIDAIPEPQRLKLRDKVLSRPDEAAKLGEALFLVLERMTDLEKPALLADLFLAYVDGVLSADELRRLAQAVDMAFNDDLKRLLALHRLPEKSTEPWLQYLVSSGLSRMVAGKLIDEIGSIYYEVTALGNKLRTAYFHARKGRGRKR